MDILLNDIEVRVLGSLMEKSMTTPEYYPLSLNGLTNACNQKSNRDPVVSFEEPTVIRALDSLREKQLVVLSASSRVPKYAEIFSETRKLVNREQIRDGLADRRETLPRRARSGQQCARTHQQTVRHLPHR